MRKIRRQPFTTLTVEGEPDVRRPTFALLSAAIDRMRPSGPSFVIVERPSGDFAQAGGGDGQYCVECREWGEQFVHWVAGKGTPALETHQVKMNAGFNEVRLNEVLTAADVKLLLGEFLTTGKRLDCYIWRDHTQYFLNKARHSGEIEEWPPP